LRLLDLRRKNGAERWVELRQSFVPDGEELHKSWSKRKIDDSQGGGNAAKKKGRNGSTTKPAETLYGV